LAFETTSRGGGVEGLLARLGAAADFPGRPAGLEDVTLALLVRP
jgi:hypothetical protein